MTVSVAHKHRKTGNVYLFYEFRRLFGACKFVHSVVVNAAYMTEFALNTYSYRLAAFYDMLCERNVFFKRMCRAVKHNASSAQS